MKDSKRWDEILYDDLLYKGQQQIFSRITNAFVKEDHISMCYLSIPVIENALRNLLFLCDRSIYEESKEDAYENVKLTRILKTLEEYLDEDIIFILRFILNEKAGLNLRNRLAHGLINDAEINVGTSTTLFYVLMILRFLVNSSHQNE
ncbi:DUF4209 domain-containing protein [Bhargavaea cecembensis]|uniref:DUF4209 domain-containing protein n=1 Tax=Bhargavaea cecembensis TaxID=394098 RepID=UPI0012688D05|nr:DUF4209 domain-containing protein [Bhargavaea cecembensis]